MDHHRITGLYHHSDAYPLIKALPSWRRPHSQSNEHSHASTLGESGNEDVAMQPKRRCFQRRKFRNKKRKERWNTSRQRIDLKDWPSDVPLPSINPPSLRLHEGLFPPVVCDTKQQVFGSPKVLHPYHAQDLYKSDWKTPWDLSLDESGESTTDVGFTTSTVSALSWEYDDLGSNSMSGAVLSEPSSGSSEVFTPASSTGGRQRNIMICEDRLTTWRKEESSPTFFLLALITVLLLTGFLSSPEALFKPQLSESTSHNQHPSRSTSITPDFSISNLHYSPPPTHPPRPAGASAFVMTKTKESELLSENDLALPMLTQAHILESQAEDDINDTPNTETQAEKKCRESESLEVEEDSASEQKLQWTTFGVDRRKTTPLRLTVFSVGAAVSVYAWQWF